jgi:hypothetical protein
MPRPCEETGSAIGISLCADYHKSRLDGLCAATLQCHMPQRSMDMTGRPYTVARNPAGAQQLVQDLNFYFNFVFQDRTLSLARPSMTPASLALSFSRSSLWMISRSIAELK